MTTPPPVDDRVGSDPLARFLSRMGFVSLLCYAAVLGLSFEFRYGEGHADRPIPAVLATLLVAFIVYLVVAKAVVRAPRDRLIEPARLRLIVGYAVAFRLVLLPSAPIQEIDYFRYLWDGQVLAAGGNPFRYSPEQVERLGPSAPPESDLAEMWDVANRSETVRTLFDRVHHREVPTIYPPASQVVFATVAAITPADASLGTHTLVLKLYLLGFDLGTLAVLVALLRRLRLPATWCVGYAWCPIVMKELSNSAHLDAIAVFFTTVAVYLFASVRRRAGSSRERWLALGGGAFLGLGILAKSYPVVLGPVVAALLLARLGWRCVFPLAVCGAVVLGGYAPFYSPKRADSGNTPVTGLGTFLGRWEMNDFLFMIVHENLRPASAGGAERWFVVVPDARREDVVAGIRTALGRAGFDVSERQTAFLLTQGVMGLALTGIVLRLAIGTYRRPTRRIFLRAAFLTLGWAWLFTSAANPWYLLWALPLVVFAGRRAWWLLPGLALTYYLRFWMEYRSLASEGALQEARNLFDFGVVWLEYLPFFVLLAAETLLPRPRRSVPPAR
mgnify:CR=1 FL=1